MKCFIIYFIKLNFNPVLINIRCIINFTSFSFLLFLLVFLIFNVNSKFFINYFNVLLIVVFIKEVNSSKFKISKYKDLSE